MARWDTSVALSGRVERAGNYEWRQGLGLGDILRSPEQLGRDAYRALAIVERTVKQKGTREQAKAYLDFLYSDEGQEVAAKHWIRPRSQAILAKYSDTFKPIDLFTVNTYFGSLSEAQKVHFNDGGLFDTLYTAGK